jgi:outer membrane receptor for ferrienterochelin and colicin
MFSTKSQCYKTILLLVFLLQAATVLAHEIPLKGKVVEQSGAIGDRSAIPGAIVRCLENDSVVTTGSQGDFIISVPGHFPIRLVAGFIGYQADTIVVTSENPVEIELKRTLELQEVEVSGRQGSVSYSTLNPINVETVTEREILKAACCNLSEAFETSPTVNVAYTDAVTGAKEIRLLGLSGIYSQLLTEAVPNFRGIAGSYGLYFIPGPWMESIQVIKGNGSVQQGYEATSGQINVEFKKPFDEEVPRFYLNLFGEQNGNMEVNLHARHKLNDSWSTILMAHGNYMEGNQDRQQDGFLDIPHARQLNFYNRWQYNSGKRLESQLGWRLIHDERQGGQYASSVHAHTELYTTDVVNRRGEVFGKLGIVFPEKPEKSIGNIAQLTVHQLDSRFGIVDYDASQRTLLLQSIYQNTFSSCSHKYKIGLNYRYDRWVETIDSVERVTLESVPGVFAEYTYNYFDELSVVVGNRLDYHNTYSWIYTPRLHARYNFTEDILIRISAGRSFRVPNIYSDNLSMLASSRQIVVGPDVQPERAWNYGFNATWRFEWKERGGTLNFDAYRTEFTSQLVVDRVTAFDKVSLYNLNGQSYSNSAQLAIDYEVLEGFTVRTAYKMDDVRVTYNDSLQRKPLVPRNRMLLNLAYETPNEHWRFDYTIVREGRKRLLPTFTDPTFDSALEQSPVFITMNLQITKQFRRFEVYAGSENLLNYLQEYPIVNANDPFGPAFDATNIWGPIDGRRIYAGLRYSIL